MSGRPASAVVLGPRPPRPRRSRGVWRDGRPESRVADPARAGGRLELMLAGLEVVSAGSSAGPSGRGGFVVRTWPVARSGGGETGGHRRRRPRRRRVTGSAGAGTGSTAAARRRRRLRLGRRGSGSAGGGSAAWRSGSARAAARVGRRRSGSSAGRRCGRSPLLGGAAQLALASGRLALLGGAVRHAVAPASSRAGARRPASPRWSGPRCAAASRVVKRSSWSSTGTLTAASRRWAKARVSVVWAVSAPDSESGRPTTTRSAPSSSTSARRRPNPRRVAGASTGSSGVASTPVGSLTAQPQRALP